MIKKDEFKKMAQSKPYKAESIYLYAKAWRENLKNGNALDVESLRYQNFEDNLDVIRTGHDSLFDDVEELIAIWENEIAV